MSKSSVNIALNQDYESGDFGGEKYKEAARHSRLYDGKNVRKKNI